MSLYYTRFVLEERKHNPLKTRSSGCLCKHAGEEFPARMVLLCSVTWVPGFTCFRTGLVYTSLPRINTSLWYLQQTSAKNQGTEMLWDPSEGVIKSQTVDSSWERLLRRQDTGSNQKCVLGCAAGPKLSWMEMDKRTEPLTQLSNDLLHVITVSALLCI